MPLIVTQAALHQKPRQTLGPGLVLLALLMLVSVVAQLDRGVVAYIVAPLQADLGFDDVEVALLQGAAFTLLYVTFGVPLGYAADRLPRLPLLAAGVALWSMATLGGAFAEDFETLFLCRVVVGFGEATLTPCAVSLIGDAFAPGQRGKALSAYQIGSAIGAGAAAFTFGAVLDHASAGSFDGLPGLIAGEPWRMTMVIPAVAGLALAAALLLGREPGRDAPREDRVTTPGWREVAAYFSARWRVFGSFYGGFALFCAGSFALASWGPAMIARTYQLSAGQLGASFSLTQIGGSLLGILACGALLDRVLARWGMRGRFAMLAAGPCLVLPASLAGMAATPLGAMTLLGSAAVGGNVVGVTMIASSQDLVPRGMRGVAVSLLGLTSALAGSLGPVLVGLITDHLLADRSTLRIAIPLVVVPAFCLATLAFGAGFREAGRAAPRTAGHHTRGT